MNQLITPGEAYRRLLEDPGVVVLDVSWTLDRGPLVDEYRASHIDGAHFIDLDATLSDRPGVHGRHPLPASSAFAEAMSTLGLTTETPIICYDRGDMMGASRCWFTLRYFGVENCSVINGGLAAWMRAGHPTSDSVVPSPAPSEFIPSVDGRISMTIEEVRSITGRGRLVDARSPERFRGESEPVDPVAGHIPGACSLPLALFAAEGGGFVTGPGSAAILKVAGIMDPGPIVTYCGSGVTASALALVLEEAGLDDVRVYVGSWSEWIAQPDAEIGLG